MIVVILILAVSGLIIFLVFRSKRRKSLAAKDKLMTVGHPHISIPTLGTQYELNSLLSINTIGRKGSHQSEISFGSGYNLTSVGVKTENILDSRVSKYIDHDIGQDVVDYSNDDTLETILNTTLDQDYLTESKTALAPRAEKEIFGSLRKSKLHGSQSVDDPVSPPALAPELTVSPPSPAGSDRERPKSEILSAAPALPVKRSVGHAASEMSLLHRAEVAEVTGGSERVIKIEIAGELPNIPPKLKPFIPPKQTINKSKEDVKTLNKVEHEPLQ